MAAIIYPSVDQVIAYNALSLSHIRVKKADQHEVRSRATIRQVIADAAATAGSVYVQAAVLLTGMVRVHAFASGNRRTALLVTRDCLLSNRATFGVRDDPANARILQGIREGFYTLTEIQEWLRTGDLHAA
jgi:prophage maintenance system killer protein